jgi:predicted enzyme related to lactoylglutathione lyase
MLRKNPIAWVSIPVTDMARAVAFYNKVFDLSLKASEEMGRPIAFLPSDQSSYGTSGALSAGPTKPGLDGPIAFFGCAGDLSVPLGRVKAAGGKVLDQKSSIGQHGFVAQFQDSEGNRIGLHSME